MRTAVKKSKNFIAGALILSAGGIITKILGAVYRIPLTNLLGTNGMGIYQLIFPFYTLLLAASSAGIPSAISRLIAERLKLNDYKGSAKIFKTAFIALSIAGLFFSAVLFFSSDYIAALQGNSDSAAGYKMIAPAVLFVSQIAVLRGYFQGRLSMVPTALSQITEQIVKIAVTLIIATSFLPDITKVVTFSILAVSISEAAALIFLIIIYFAGKKKRESGLMQAETKQIGTLRAAFMVFAISVPITIGSIILPLSQIIDSTLVVNIIGRYYAGSAISLYGIFSGPVYSLISLPVVITSGIAVAAIPAISAARVSGDREGIKNKIEFVLKLTFLIAILCGIGMFFFSENIISMLYGSFSKAEVLTASDLLKISSLSVLFISLMQAAVSILVAMKRAVVTTLNLLIAVIIKIALNVVLLNIPALNIYGAAISAVMCYFTAAVLNYLFVLKFAQIKINFYGIIFKPFLCACLTITMALGFYWLFNLFLTQNLSLVTAILLSVPVFILFVLKLKIFTDYEIKFIPLIKKLKIIKIK